MLLLGIWREGVGFVADEGGGVGGIRLRGCAGSGHCTTASDAEEDWRLLLREIGRAGAGFRLFDNELLDWGTFDQEFDHSGHIMLCRMLVIEATFLAAIGSRG
jgi:hypothetical protein